MPGLNRATQCRYGGLRIASGQLDCTAGCVRTSTQARGLEILGDRLELVGTLLTSIEIIRSQGRLDVRGQHLGSGEGASSQILQRTVERVDGRLDLTLEEPQPRQSGLGVGAAGVGFAKCLLRPVEIPHL